MVDVKIEICKNSWIKYIDSASDLVISDESVGKSILLIDNDISFSNSIHKFLVNLGYVVQTAQNENDVSLICKNRKLNIILLGIDISTSNYLGLMWKMKMYNNFSDIIIFSDYSGLIMAKKMIRLGSRDYIIKPSEPQLIIEKIEKSLILQSDPLAIYIRKNVGKIHSKDEVAKYMKMSQSTLSRHVSKVTGYSFQNYQQQCRIEEAEKYIVQGKLTMKEIAREVGMTPPAFSRLFNQLTGRSPRKFQREVHI